MNNKVIDACAMKANVFTGDANVYSVYFDGINDIYKCENTPEKMRELENLIN